MSRWCARTVLPTDSTELLELAARLAWDPTELPWVLARHLDSEVVWRADRGHDIADGTVLRLPDPDGGTLEFRRPGAAYTTDEVTQARALTDLAARLRVTAVPREWTVMLPDGQEVTLRRTGIADLAAVEALHRRCSARSRRWRYLTAASRQEPEWLERLVAPRTGYTLAAQTDNEEIVGLATAHWDGQEAEIGILVEDQWQGRRVGTALLRRLTTLAEEMGVRVLHAHTTADNAVAPRLARRFGGAVTVRRADSADPIEDIDLLVHLGGREVPDLGGEVGPGTQPGEPGIVTFSIRL